MMTLIAAVKDTKFSLDNLRIGKCTVLCTWIFFFFPMPGVSTFFRKWVD